MPAGSERVPELPHTWRPLGPRLAAVAFGGALAVVCAFTWIGFDEDTQAAFTTFQFSTLAALGLLIFGSLHALMRSRVVAERERLVVVNGYRRHEYAWAQVVAVNLPPGAPWVTLDLADGHTVSAMGIQGSDGQRARVAARQLRTLVTEIPG